MRNDLSQNAVIRNGQPRAAMLRGVLSRTTIGSSGSTQIVRTQQSLLQRQQYLAFSAALIFTALMLVLSGCGSSSSTRAGAISITDPSGAVSGQLTSLAITRTATLSMTPAGDKAGAGVDWTVTCGGSPLNGSTSGGACGTLSPAHTSDTGATVYTAPPLVPYLTNVTITASVTSDPAASSITTLPIVALPIAVTFTTSVPSVPAGQMANFAATALNDTGNQGVAWSVTCGSSDCGSFSPATTAAGVETAYTAPASAPAGGSVMVTATSVSDTTKSATVPVMITGGSSGGGGISVVVTPATVYAAVSGPSRTEHFTATVSNDPAMGGVIWSLTCGSSSCGSITPSSASGVSVTFLGPLTAPTGGRVTVTATSVTDPTRTATAVATIVSTAPISVTLAASTPATLTVGTTASLSATVAGDSANTGVNWTATCATAGACGSFNLSPVHTASGGAIVYTAPATAPGGGTVTITAASASTSPANSASATVAIVPPAATVAFVQQPPASITATARVPVSAAVANDGTPAGITWSVQCPATDPGACGYVTPVQTADNAVASYVAPPIPPSGPVTIIATSTAFPDVTASSMPVTVTAATAISIGFVPFAPAQLSAGATVNLTAAVNNDTTSAGVDWQVCASGCGYFTVKAAIPEIPGTATTPLIPAVPAVTATTVQSWPNGLAIPYTAPISAPQGGSVAIGATAHVDGATTIAANIAILAGAANTVTGPALSGVVQAGTLPVAGAAVSLYAAGTSGYGSASAQLAPPNGVSSAITNSNGGFTFAGGYTCPQGASQLYLVAVGGAAGSNAVNPNLSMMTALGSCSNLGSTPVVINEVTTVASVWPLAQFSTNQPLTGLSGYLHIGSSSANSLGLANAFAAVNNLVDITTGQPLYNVPAANAAVPYVEINTLADVLNSCTASAGGQYGDGTSCGNLFANTAPLYAQPQFGSVPPSDTIQAAFNAAQNPTSGSLQYRIGTSSLYALVAASAPFQPILPSTFQDLSISLHFTGGGGLDATSGANFFALDGAGNLWITATADDRVVEWNTVGAAISPLTGFTEGGINAPGPIAIDSSNNVWVANADSLSELNNNGLAAQGSPFYGVNNGLNMAIDGLNNIWITNPGGVTEYNSVGTELSPVGGYVNDGVSGISQIAIDGSNNIWVGDQPNQAFDLALLTDTGAQLVIDEQLAPAQMQTPIVADGAGNIWATPASQLCHVPQYTGVGSIPASPCTTAGDIAGILNAEGIAVDGVGNLWIANTGGPASGGTQALSPSLTEIIPSQISSNHYGSLAAPSLGVGTLQVAIDGSGNVWVLLADNTVTEYIGAAVPAVTPVAAAIKSKKLGKTP